MSYSHCFTDILEANMAEARGTLIEYRWSRQISALWCITDILKLMSIVTSRHFVCVDCDTAILC
jgi:hypothetical protein